MAAEQIIQFTSHAIAAADWIPFDQDSTSITFKTTITQLTAIITPLVLRVGNVVFGGSANKALFTDNSGNLANSPFVDVSGTVDGLLIDVSGTGASAAILSASGRVADLAKDNMYAARFTDGVNNLEMCDGTNAITVQAGQIATPGTVGNTLLVGDVSGTPTNPAIVAAYMLIQSGSSTFFAPLYQ